MARNGARLPPAAEAGKEAGRRPLGAARARPYRSTSRALRGSAGAAGRMEAGNRIGGERVPSRGAGRFERHAPADGRALGTWPRSDGRDVAAACAALRTARDAAEPVERGTLAEAARLLADGLRGGGAGELDGAFVGAFVGLEGEEAERLALGVGERLVDAVRRAPEPAAAPGGIALVVSDWRELLAGPFLRAAAALGRGRSPLLLGDERFPAAAEVAVDSLLAAGIPAERLALLHGPSDDAVAAAIGADGVLAISGCGSRRRVAAWRRRLQEHRLLEQELRVPRVAALEIVPGRPLPEQASEAVRRAFGRVAALSGQADGALCRIHCPDRLHSAFTAALLEELRASPDVALPVPFVDREAAEAATRAFALGLDEGATPIFGEGPGRGQGDPARATVFTNVELAMRSARRREPAPVLALLRA